MIDPANYHQIYYAPENMRATALNLLHFAFRQALSATHLKDFDELNELMIENGELTKIMDDDKIMRLRKFIFEGLIDSIRISICYENFMKGILLANGYLVHVIDRKKDRNLSILQKKEPIPISEFRIENKPKKNPKSGMDEYPTLTKRTLSFENLLKRKYQDVIKIPESILVIVKKLYLKRNQQHFYNSETFSYSLKVINEFDELKKYTAGILITLNNKLVKSLNGPEHHYINPKDFQTANDSDKSHSSINENKLPT